MDFNFSDDQEQLRDAVRKWVDKGYDFERRRGIEAAGGFSREAWDELMEMIPQRIEAKLTQGQSLEPLFTIRWSLV